MELPEPETFLLSMGVGALAGNIVGGATVAIVVGLAVYVLAAVHPQNRTTCPLCGELVYPRATVCRAC